MKEQFKLFLSQLSETNSTLELLTDFKKVSENVNKISLKLCQLNHLLGREDLKNAIQEIWDENEKAFSVLGILVAVRDNKVVLDSRNLPIGLNNYFLSVDRIYEYIKKTGLDEIFTSRKITNLVDYVFGVEVGLDTNARKNRGGTVMEDTVGRALTKAGINFRTQVNSSEFIEIESLGEDLKRFDFVVETKNKTLLDRNQFL